MASAFLPLWVHCKCKLKALIVFARAETTESTDSVQIKSTKKNVMQQSIQGNGFHTTGRQTGVGQLSNQRSWYCNRNTFEGVNPEISSDATKSFFPFIALTPPLPHLVLWTDNPDLGISSIHYVLLTATHPPYPLMGNCKGHAGTTAVQPGGGTQGAVKHKEDCLSERTKACVSLWGIPLPPLALCVYNRFVWLEKVMWVKRRKEEGCGAGGRKKTSVWDDVCVCACSWLCVCAHMWMCVKWESHCSECGGIWGPRSFPISLSFRSAQTHWEAPRWKVVLTKLKQALRTLSLKHCPNLPSIGNVVRHSKLLWEKPVQLWPARVSN